MTWTDWMKDGPFYMIGFVYTFARVCFKMVQTMLPFYLYRVTVFKAKPGYPTPIQIATVPLVSYICQLLYSIFV